MATMRRRGGAVARLESWAPPAAWGCEAKRSESGRSALVGAAFAVWWRESEILPGLPSQSTGALLRVVSCGRGALLSPWRVFVRGNQGRVEQGVVLRARLDAALEEQRVANARVGLRIRQRGRERRVGRRGRVRRLSRYALLQIRQRALERTLLGDGAVVNSARLARGLAAALRETRK